MKQSSVLSFAICVAVVLAIALCASAQSQTNVQVGTTAGVSGLWVLANVSYAGMRAQSNPNAVWRVLAFIFGLPGTLLTFLVVQEGGERAYGVDLPRKGL